MAATGRTSPLFYLCMKKIVIYPTVTGERFTCRSFCEKTKVLICVQSLGRVPDKGVILSVCEADSDNRWVISVLSSL